MSNSKNTHRPSDIIKAEISKLNPDARLAYGRHMAAQNRYNFLAELCVGQLTAQRGGEDLDTPANLGGLSMAWIDSDHGHKMASAAQLVTVLESSDAYIEAQDKLIPLLAELDASEQAEADHNHSVNLAKQAVHKAEKAAQERALAESANDPELAKARKKLESTLGKVS